VHGYDLETAERSSKKMNDPDFKKKQEKLWLELEAQHIKQFGRNTK